MRFGTQDLPVRDLVLKLLYRARLNDRFSRNESAIHDPKNLYFDCFSENLPLRNSA